MTKITETPRERALKRAIREELDAFERRERLLKAEERKERARQFKLPLDLQNKVQKSRIHSLENS
jgi:hypothetical protein